MKKTTLKTRILLFVLMFLLVASLATVAIIPIKNAIEKSHDNEQVEDSHEGHGHS